MMKIPCFEVEPLQVWYYHISLNSRTLVILLQVNPVFGDEPETIYEGYTKLETPPSLHGLQFLTLDTIVGYSIQFVDCLLITKQIT
jgi:hypothetical protein